MYVRMATRKVHQRSVSELRQSPQSPYLPDSAIRAPKAPVFSVESPSKLPRPVLFNDSGSEMFLAVSFRKETQQHLQIMENRVKALQKAEDDAKRKLETARRLTREKSAFMDSKNRDTADMQQWRADVERARSTSRIRLGKERVARQERLQQAREKAFERRIGKALEVKQELNQRFADMREALRLAQERKISKRENIQNHHKEAKVTAESNQHHLRTRLQSEFQDKLEAERRHRSEMDRRIRELEELETQLTENLKRTCSFHSQEVQRLEQLVRS